MVATGGGQQVPLDTAASYVALGLVVLSECPPTCTCSHPGKRPWDAVERRHLGRWQRAVAPTAAEIDACLAADAERVARGLAPANIGCRCGPRCLGEEGLIGADADGERGIADLAAHLGLAAGQLEAALAEHREHGIFRLTLGTAAYRTQGGDLRLLWRAPAGVNLHTIGGDGDHDGLGLFWDGKQVVLPPSQGPDGDYRWLPGHSPWQVGFAVAPASVLATMATTKRTSRGATVGTVFVPPPGLDVADLVARVQAQLSDRQREVLQAGVAKGRRSHAIWALVNAIIESGVHDQIGVLVLAAQPWIAAKYGADPLKGVMAEFARARQKGAEARYIPCDLQLMQPLDAAAPGARDVPVTPPQTTNQGTDSPEAGAREAHDGAGAADEQAGETGPQPTHRRWEPDPHYERRGKGPHRLLRLRTYDADRAAKVRDGLDLMGVLLGGSAPANERRMSRHLHRQQESYDRCRTEAWGSHHEARERASRRDHGDAYLWCDEPCDARGCEDCSPYHALRELGKGWGPALEAAYPGPVAVAALAAPGWGLRKVRTATRALLDTASVKAMLPMACGYLIAEGGKEPGYAFHVLVPEEQAEQARRVLLREWRKQVPCGWVRSVEDLPPACTALEAMIELSARSEQALPLLAASQEILLPRATEWYAREIGVSSGSETGGQLHRRVIGAGLRALRKDIREKAKQQMAQAAGAENASGPAAGPGSGTAQGVATTAGAESRMGSEGCGPIRDFAGVGAGDAGTAGASGAAADRRDDDGGWMPAPWDPTIEIRPSRDRKRGPAKLPWFVLKRMAEDGDAEPIIVDGRVVGYLVPPGARRRAAGADGDPRTG